MKLTGELKEKVAKAESSEEAKKVIEEAGFELTDEEVENVAGGIGPGYWAIARAKRGIPTSQEIV